MKKKKLIYQCRNPQSVIETLLASYGITGYLIRLSPSNEGVLVYYDERLALQKILGTSDGGSIFINRLANGIPVWEAKELPPDLANLFDEIDGGNGSVWEPEEDPIIFPAVPAENPTPPFDLAQLQPQLRPVSTTELREQFITLTSDYFMEGARRELREAMQEREAVATICSAFPTLARESNIRLAVAEREQVLFREQLHALAKKLHDEQVRVLHEHGALLLEFSVCQKTYHLVCQKKAEPSLRMKGYTKPVALPFDIQGAMIGLVARLSFSDAVELIKAHLEDA